MSNWACHMTGLGPSFMKIWTFGSSPRSGSRNAWTQIKIVNGARRLSNFWYFFGAIHMISCRARLVTVDETWLYHYDPETKQQSMEWRHSGSPRPKIFRVQKSAGKVLACLDFLGSRRHPLHWLSSKCQNINAEYYSSLLVQLKYILKEKRRGKFTKGFLFSHDNAPAHRVHATQKKLSYLGIQCLDHPPYSLDLAPSGYHLFSGLKNNWKVANFRPTRRSLLPRRPGWTEKFLIFFLNVLQKLEQWAKKCIELRGEYVE